MGRDQSILVLRTLDDNGEFIYRVCCVAAVENYDDLEWIHSCEVAMWILKLRSTKIFTDEKLALEYAEVMDRKCRADGIHKAYHDKTLE